MRTEKLTEIPEKLAFLHQLPEYGTELFVNKKSKCTPEIALELLLELYPELTALPDPIAPESVTAILTACAERHQVKLGQVMWAVRIALAGVAVTPGGPGEIMAVLGAEESQRRLDVAIAKLQG